MKASHEKRVMSTTKVTACWLGARALLAVSIGCAVAATVVLALVATGGARIEVSPRSPSRPSPMTFIVQAKSMACAAATVREIGGEVTRELEIIEAVATTLTPEQVRRVARRCAECRLFLDRSTHLMGWGSTPDAAFPTLVGATLLHQEGITGRGVTVAVLDSGFLDIPAYEENTAGWRRIKAQYDAFSNTVRTWGFVTDDSYGHGSHVTGIIASSTRTSAGLYHGIAPDAGLVSVRAFDQNGGSTYATVIQAIGWVVANKARYGIRVLNASFGAPVGSWYWDDPMNQAIMKAWQAGIVVVVSAGNTGPGAMTVQAPANVPYVITVGAMTDNYTPPDGTDDYLATFSAAGPTYEAFPKPDLVAPGGHDLSYIQRASNLGIQFPQYFIDNWSGYFRLSGTSQAAAVVSGVAALMLQANSALSPDDVKCGLMSTAQAGRTASGTIPYTIFQQGAGLVTAWAAVHQGLTGCANNGLDIAADVAGTQHFGGTAAQDSNGNYYLLDQTGAGTTWNGTYTKTGGYPWSSGYPWSNGYPWSSGYPWSNGYPWTSSTTSSTTGRTSYAGNTVSAKKTHIPPMGSKVRVPAPGRQQ